MRDYGKVHSSFWSSQTISALSEDGRMLALYLMTSPHTTITGTFRLPDGYAREDLGWSSQRVAEGFEELFRNGFANRCETTKWVWICKHLEWNPPENPNQRKSAVKVVASIPDECCWKGAFLRDSGPLIGIENANPCETVTKPFRNQKQEQEQEQKQERGDASGKAARSPTGSRLPADWQPAPEEIRWAQTARPELSIPIEIESFRDYWAAKPGKDGRKADWSATWRNWIRRANGPRGMPTQATTTNGSPAAGRKL